MVNTKKDKKQVLPDNPLFKFNTYTTYFTIKLGNSYNSQNKTDQVLPGGHASKENRILLDTRGQDLNSAGIAQRPNEHPRLTVKHFDVMHFFNHRAEATFGLDSTLRIFERGSATYLQEIGEIMLELDVTNIANLVLWVGVGIYGWESQGQGTFATWNPVPISQKWFPFHIHKVDVNIKSSGAEYTHWLKGWVYHRSTDVRSQHLNNVITTGNNINDHLLDLLSKAENNSIKTRKEQEAKKEKQPIGQENRDVLKKINYTFTLEKGIDGTSFSKDAIVVGDTTTQNTGGKIDIHSGGESGETTVVNHIREILSRSPSISKTLKENNSWYKIVPRTEISEKEETITYAILPYRLDSKGLLPLKRFTYFFGGTNEEVIQFDFNLDGLYSVLPQAIIASTRSAREKDTSENESARQARFKKDTIETPKPSQGKTDEAKVTAANQLGHKTTGSFPPNKSKANNFYKNNTQAGQELYLNLLDNVEAYVGTKLLEGGFKIIGDPNLILDETTIEELKPEAPLESAINYVTFDIGTPNPEFPEVPEVGNFIFNGYYGIRTLKSVFSEDGKFTQELNVYWRSELADLARGEDDNPDKFIDFT